MVTTTSEGVGRGTFGTPPCPDIDNGMARGDPKRGLTSGSAKKLRLKSCRRWRGYNEGCRRVLERGKCRSRRSMIDRVTTEDRIFSVLRLKTHRNAVEASRPRSSGLSHSRLGLAKPIRALGVFGERPDWAGCGGVSSGRRQGPNPYGSVAFQPHRSAPDAPLWAQVSSEIQPGMCVLT